MLQQRGKKRCKPLWRGFASVCEGDSLASVGNLPNRSTCVKQSELKQKTTFKVFCLNFLVGRPWITDCCRYTVYLYFSHESQFCWHILSILNHIAFVRGTWRFVSGNICSVRPTSRLTYSVLIAVKTREFSVGKLHLRVSYSRGLINACCFPRDKMSFRV